MFRALLFAAAIGVALAATASPPGPNNIAQTCASINRADLCDGTHQHADDGACVTGCYGAKPAFTNEGCVGSSYCEAGAPKWSTGEGNDDYAIPAGGGACSCPSTGASAPAKTTLVKTTDKPASTDAGLYSTGAPLDPKFEAMVNIAIGLVDLSKMTDAEKATFAEAAIAEIVKLNSALSLEDIKSVVLKKVGAARARRAAAEWKVVITFVSTVDAAALAATEVALTDAIARGTFLPAVTVDGADTTFSWDTPAFSSRVPAGFRAPVAGFYKGDSVGHVKGISLEECGRRCVAKKARCRSFQYHAKTQTCGLKKKRLFYKQLAKDKKWHKTYAVYNKLW